VNLKGVQGAKSSAGVWDAPSFSFSLAAAGGINQLLNSYFNFYITQQWLKAIVSLEMCSFEKQKMWQYRHTFSYLIIPQITA